MKRAAIEPLLPNNFRRTLAPGSPLAALLDVMEDLHAPSEEVLAGEDAYFDSRRTPDRFVPYLAGWVDLAALLEEGRAHGGPPPEFPSGSGRLRELISLASYFSRWRGTLAGVRRFLEVATGETGFAIDENPGGRAFHLAVRAPRSSEGYRALIERIVELEKPAHVTFELVFE